MATDDAYRGFIDDAAATRAAIGAVNSRNEVTMGSVERLAEVLPAGHIE